MFWKKTKMSEKLNSFYKKIEMPCENIVMPLILLLWPLVKIAQGVDVSDSTYSLGNYLFADRLEGVWVVSTYISNALGALLVRLPGGDTMLGMNFYTGLLVSIIALFCYYSLKKDLKAPLVFVGEFIAISFCWIPTGILYNYLTYLLFTVGSVVLFRAICDNKKIYFFLAGLILGHNVFVRIPNLAEMALIVVLWTSALFVKNKDTSATDSTPVLASTVICILGYVTGIIIPAIVITIRFGTNGIVDMITGLSDMSSSNSEYTLFSMIVSTVMAYINSFKWLLIVLAVICFGIIMYLLFEKIEIIPVSRAKDYILGAVFFFGLMVMIRFFWGRGMFSFRYYEDYTSMYEWGMLTLFLGWILAFTVIFRKCCSSKEKTYAVLVIMILVVTPLGSNNYTCQNLNNMFLIMPFIISTVYDLIFNKEKAFRLGSLVRGINLPWIATVGVILLITFIQTSLFHVNFVFRDGMDGTPRNTKVYSIPSLVGMKTNAKNARDLEELSIYIEGEEAIESAIFWGDCPGLSYILRLPSAISTTWPDLASYPVKKLDLDLMELASSDSENGMAIIMKKQKDELSNTASEKMDILMDYVVSRHMVADFENEEYIVYKTMGEN